jgi:hypothetical protein
MTRGWRLEQFVWVSGSPLFLPLSLDQSSRLTPVHIFLFSVGFFIGFLIQLSFRRGGVCSHCLCLSFYIYCIHVLSWEIFVWSVSFCALGFLL